MRVESLHIEGFRSIYDADFQPGPLTVLVGPNNSGKSTFAEALDFVSDIANVGLEVAVARKGGFDNIAFRRQRRTRRAISFRIRASLEPGELFSGGEADTAIDSLCFNYGFALRASSQSRIADFSVESETLLVSALQGSIARPLARFRRTPDGEIVLKTNIPKGEDELRRIFEPLDDRGYANFLIDRVAPTSLLISDLEVSLAVWWLLRELGNARIYRLSPAECRKPGSPTPNPHLDMSGENLPAVARFLRQQSDESWAEILRQMRGIMPDLESIDPDFTSDRRLTLLFREKGFGRPWTSAEVSDGTIQSLALFTALLDPRTSIPLIEEPENSIHPWIIRTFVDGCREVMAKQVIVTTHSPALIAYLQPQEVCVVWRSNGRTQMAPLVEVDPKAQKLWESGEFDLFELTDGGYIEETIPQGFT